MEMVTLKKPWYISGKNTHTSRISNSVTYLRTYTNTAIADITRNSAPGADITQLSTDITLPSADITPLSANITAPSAGVAKASANVVALTG